MAGTGLSSDIAIPTIWLHRPYYDKKDIFSSFEPIGNPSTQQKKNHVRFSAEFPR